MCAFPQETTSYSPRQDLSLALNLASKLGCLVSEPTWLHLPCTGILSVCYHILRGPGGINSDPQAYNSSTLPNKPLGS